MTPRISFVTAVVGAALVLAGPAFGDSWGADRDQAPVRISPDLVDRVAAAKQQELSSMLDARERSFAAKSEATIVVSPDPVRDDRFRLDPASIPRAAATISSAHGTEWVQIGMGFGGGVLLVIGLLLAARMTRPRLPAH
jgi:hypothetical protein